MRFFVSRNNNWYSPLTRRQRRRLYNILDGAFWREYRLGSISSAAFLMDHAAILNDISDLTNDLSRSI
jgi:hypothetical protein